MALLVCYWVGYVLQPSRHPRAEMQLNIIKLIFLVTLVSVALSPEPKSSCRTGKALSQLSWLTVHCVLRLHTLWPAAIICLTTVYPHTKRLCYQHHGVLPIGTLLEKALLPLVEVACSPD